MSSLFFIKLLFGLFAFIFARNNFILIAIYLLLNKTFSEAICRHSALVISDLVDEDFVINKRSSTKVKEKMKEKLKKEGRKRKEKESRKRNKQEETKEKNSKQKEKQRKKPEKKSHFFYFSLL